MIRSASVQPPQEATVSCDTDNRERLRARAWQLERVFWLRNGQSGQIIASVSEGKNILYSTVRVRMY